MNGSFDGVMVLAWVALLASIAIGVYLALDHFLGGLI